MEVFLSDMWMLIFFLTLDILMISKMAVNEFQYGSVELGKTVLDSTLTAYPKRVDLWLLYANQMIKKGEFEMARYVNCEFS